MRDAGAVLICSMNVWVDGFVADREGAFGGRFRTRSRVIHERYRRA
ncbi:MAG TPA: hypothetical protein VI357_05305 [Mycobacteriales bacterium]